MTTYSPSVPGCQVASVPRSGRAQANCREDSGQCADGGRGAGGGVGESALTAEPGDPCGRIFEIFLGDSNLQETQQNHIRRRNREKDSLAAKTRYAANAAKILARQKSYRTANLDYCRRLDRELRAKLKAADPVAWAAKTKLKRLRGKAQTKRALPKWADSAAIRTFYEAAYVLSLEVDHIVPLRSPLVCGLHVEHNLQLLTRQENAAKGNRWRPDMPEGIP